jgi:formate hydrogenlyase subunit 4
MAINIIVIIIIYLALAPFFGGILSGLDRKITARLQGRVGPPIVQPFYDVLKLLEKENLVVRKSQNLYILFFLIAIIFTGGLFFTGENILVVIFALTLAEIFFVLGAYKASSPYSFLGAERELLQMLAYEPAFILAAIGMYLKVKSFHISEIAFFQKPLVIYLPGLLLAFIFALAIKFRKSPFDLSMSHHHAHQELVRGITTEFSGKALGLIEVAHWFDNAIMLGFAYLFFGYNLKFGLAAVLAVYFLVILIDNVFARVKWQMAIASSWIITLVFGLGNIIILFFVHR